MCSVVREATKAADEAAAAAERLEEAQLHLDNLRDLSRQLSSEVEAATTILVPVGETTHVPSGEVRRELQSSLLARSFTLS